MRRSRVIAVFALASVVGVLGVSAWLRAARRSAAPVVEDAADRAAPMPPVFAPAAARPAVPHPSAPPRAAGPAPATPAPDQRLLGDIRATVRSDPRAAESLAREARTRFPRSPHADEWDALLVDALVNQQRIGAARSETYYYFDHHPDGAFTAHLFALTGVHPTPAAPGPR